MNVTSIIIHPQLNPLTIGDSRVTESVRGHSPTNNFAIACEKVFL
jgi:hypothetical protein